MKIALPTKGGMVDSHFGHCESFTIYTVSDGGITSVETLPVQQGCGCKSGLAATLRGMGVETVLAETMGEGAKHKLAEQGISMVCGCTGNAETAVNDYLAGKITDSGSTCFGTHGCGHHSHHGQTAG